MTDSIERQSPGKPKGYRSITDLYDRILKLLEEDRDIRKMKGRTAFSMHKELKVPDPTVRLYLKDLVKDKKVKSEKVAGITIYSIRKT
jgi:predicted transcriptional regulator